MILFAKRPSTILNEYCNYYETENGAPLFLQIFDYNCWKWTLRSSVHSKVQRYRPATQHCWWDWNEWYFFTKCPTLLAYICQRNICNHVNICDEYLKIKLMLKKQHNNNWNLYWSTLSRFLEFVITKICSVEHKTDNGGGGEKRVTIQASENMLNGERCGREF